VKWSNMFKAIVFVVVMLGVTVCLCLYMDSREDQGDTYASLDSVTCFNRAVVIDTLGWYVYGILDDGWGKSEARLRFDRVDKIVAITKERVIYIRRGGDATD